MPPILYIRYEPAEGESKTFRFASGMLTFGRDPGNDIAVPSHSVSRQHAKILPVGSHWVFCDLGSTNGSWINDEKITQDKLRLLKTGDEVILADSRFSIRLRAEPGNPLGRYVKSLLVFEDEKFLSEFSLENKEGKFTVGGPGSSIKAPDGGQEPVFEIVNEPEGVFGIPLNGYMGVERNGEQISDRAILLDGDLITFGKVRILLNDNLKTIVGDSDESTLQNVVEQHDALPAVVNTESTVSISSTAMSAMHKGWANEPEKVSRPRKFVFGKEEDSVDPNSTLAHRSDAPRKSAATDFDMNISRKISTVPMPGEKTAAQEKQRRLVIGVLFIAGSFILALVALVGFLLN